MSNYPKPSFCFYKESTAVMICKFCWRRAVCYPSTADEVDWNPICVDGTKDNVRVRGES